MTTRPVQQKASAVAAIAVVIPARDEAELLPRCLASVVGAVRVVQQQVAVHVTVVADRCTDRTEQVAVAALDDVSASIVRCDAGNVGVARQRGVAAARMVVPSSDRRMWIAMTDADSVVPRTWLRHHMAAAASGGDAMVGAVQVDDWSARASGTAAALAAHRRWQRDTDALPVHGANLGVRASALDDVGGVPAIALSEDAALVAQLHRSGRSVLRMPGSVVRTSARRIARADGGFASLLDVLERSA